MITYQRPRRAIFSIHTGEWGKHGWINEERIYTIIGETKEHFTEKYMTSGHGMWDENGKYDLEYTSAFGPHKSRFVKWINVEQLSLFK